MKKKLSHLDAKQKKLNNKARAKNKAIREILFKSQFFEKNAKTVITQAIEELNDRQHQYYTKYKNKQVEFYLNRVMVSHKKHEKATPKTARGARMISETYDTLDRVDLQIKKIVKTKAQGYDQQLKDLLVGPVSYQDISVDHNLVVYDKTNENLSNGQTIRESTEVKDLILSGFQKTISQNFACKTLSVKDKAADKAARRVNEKTRISFSRGSKTND